MPWWVFICVYYPWILLNFLDLWVYSYQIWKNLGHYFFKYFSYPYLFLPSFGDSNYIYYRQLEVVITPQFSAVMFIFQLKYSSLKSILQNVFKLSLTWGVTIFYFIVCSKFNCQCMRISFSSHVSQCAIIGQTFNFQPNR